MKDHISGAVMRKGNMLSCAAVAREPSGITEVMGSSRCIVHSGTSLHIAVKSLLVEVEEQSDIMIGEVDCYYSGGSAEDVNILAEAVRKSGVTVLSELHAFDDAAALAQWWANRF